jgi:cytosine/adenosine deaminase-related metal-dependent hydrolase
VSDQIGSRMNTLPPETWTLTAGWVFPVDGPPLERGVVAIAGDKILAVEAHGRQAVDVNLGDAAVLPGLVNAHTHLDLSAMRGLAPPTHFTDWLRQVITHRRGRTPEQVQGDVRAGLAECLRFGTTLLGDISGDGGSWDLLAEAPVRAVVFREFLGLTKERASGAWERLDRWLASRPATPTLRPGVSPHAPYSVRSSLFLAASTRGEPVAVHLAETAAEQELLALRRGPFVPFLKDLGVWDPEGLAEDTDHVLRLLNGPSPTLLVHGNFLHPAAAIPANAAVVYCPRTHAVFGHPPHPFREFLARGVRVAVGTDSLASNPDLDVLAEIRFLHRLHPDVPGATLLRMATLSGAEALGWADETGSLTPGKSADLVVVPLRGDDADPHSLVLRSDAPIWRVLFRGQWVG